MDWNMKAPSSWDLSELEQATFSNLDTVNESSSFGDQHRAIKGDFSVDLKLGQLGDSGNNQLLDMFKQHGGPKPSSSSPSGASKRSRAAYNGSQTVSCLVDGCRSDLSTCRDYHRRHKVCELHSKTPMVTINGQKQRFCQQCSRYKILLPVPYCQQTLIVVLFFAMLFDLQHLVLLCFHCYIDSEF